MAGKLENINPIPNEAQQLGSVTDSFRGWMRFPTDMLFILLQPLFFFSMLRSQRFLKGHKKVSEASTDNKLSRPSSSSHYVTNLHQNESQVLITSLSGAAATHFNKP